MSNDTYTVLVVDDSKSIVKFLLELLNHKQHNLLYCFNKTEAFKIIDSNEIDILICDLFVPEKTDGKEIVSYFKEKNPDSKVLTISAFFNADNVIECFRAGADDVLPKTFTKEELQVRLTVLKNSIGHKLVKNGRIEKESPLKEPEKLFIGNSPKIKQILKHVRKIVQYDADVVLLEGESGVGKDLLANIIHLSSSRKKDAFVALNCTAFPETLIDSELFGFEKGSFTGASRTTPGKFELADKGTLFLDEIGDIPLNFQPKLLRVLDTRSFYRLGGKDKISLDVLIIAASNQPLIDLVKRKAFRPDLFFRLNQIRISIPPIRERKEDIPLLINHFSEKLYRRFHKKPVLTEQTMKKLMAYDYPGNVRELKNVIEKAVIYSDGEVIHPEDIEFCFESEQSSLRNNGYSRECIKELLRQNKGNITKTAKMLGYTREGLSKKIKRLGLK
ncbi:MAG: sigma-54 dependent transcriptional regulator [Calditrichia bacterium]